MRQVPRYLTVLWLGVAFQCLLGACGQGPLKVSGPACKQGGGGLAAEPLHGTSLDDQSLVLTFDRSPSLYSSDIAEYLAGRGLSATFFVEGQKVKATSELAALRDQGHLIGNGTYSYGNLAKAYAPAMEVRQVDRIITPYVVGDLFLLRTPSNSFGADLAAYLTGRGLGKYIGPIGWDVESEPRGESIDLSCWADGVSASECAQRYVQAINGFKKGIVRFTDGREELKGLLRELMPSLQTLGFSIVRLDEVPEVRRAALERGARPGTSGGPSGCQDY